MRREHSSQGLDTLPPRRHADAPDTALTGRPAKTFTHTHLRRAGKVIFHSDRGTQYTSTEFDKYCKKNKITRSLGRTGICFDNAVAESFFATYKKELIHTQPWPTIGHVRRA